MIEVKNPKIPVCRQCELIGLSRSSLYYEPAGVSKYNLELMKLIDEQYTRTPFYGSPRITCWLRKRGYNVNHKRVERLMRLMGLQAIYPKPNLSKKDNKQRIYPYLLKGLEIKGPNQVWASDITFIRLAKGFIYLVAVMDWFSRYVLSWVTSITLDAGFCLEALKKALTIASPGIFNSDQGTQFTSSEFTEALLQRKILISMDGRGRVFDNIFVERLWRTLKYEEVYLKDYAGVTEAVESIGNYFRFYNNERFHQSLGYLTPREVYFNSSNFKEKQLHKTKINHLNKADILS